MNLAESIFLNEALKATAEKYEKLRLQRLSATKKWNNSHRDKVNEYNRTYQKKLYAKKKEDKKDSEKIMQYTDPEEYKRYQKAYRMTSLLRKMPFFNSQIIL